MTYQEVTGTLNPGAHPGSYNGQDAYNDMLVTDDGICNGIGTSKFRNNAGGCPTLNASHEQPIYLSDRKGHNGITDDGTATTLTSQEKERPIVGTNIVRRLTPKECERLQGFPDDWSRWGINTWGETYELKDSARYRLQGNSIARPFWTWLLRRIAAQYERPATMGSLFDGQGGFPLCGAECGIRAIWASEIEKHAIAVTKYRFPDEEEMERQDADK